MRFDKQIICRQWKEKTPLQFAVCYHAALSALKAQSFQEYDEHAQVHFLVMIATTKYLIEIEREKQVEAA